MCKNLGSCWGWGNGGLSLEARCFCLGKVRQAHEAVAVESPCAEAQPVVVFRTSLLLTPTHWLLCRPSVLGMRLGGEMERSTQAATRHGAHPQLFLPKYYQPHFSPLNAAGLCFIQHSGADRNVRADTALFSSHLLANVNLNTNFFVPNWHLSWTSVECDHHSVSCLRFPSQFPPSVFHHRRSSFESRPQAPLPVPVLIFLLLVFVVVLLLVLGLQPQDGPSSHQSHQEEAERGPGGQRHGRQRARGQDEPVICHAAVSTHAVLSLPANFLRHWCQIYQIIVLNRGGACSLHTKNSLCSI